VGTAHQLVTGGQCPPYGEVSLELCETFLTRTQDGAFSVWYYPPRAAYATEFECDDPVAKAASPLEQVQKSETMREFVAAKLHGLRVTGKSLEYEGSASLATSLMEAAGISPYERVYLVNKSTGSRWDTYAIPGREGEFTLNGAAARLGEVGDEILLWTFRQEERFTGANVVFLNEFNKIERCKTYPAEEPSAVEF
jgi:aspartate 1-decarboxylase